MKIFSGLRQFLRSPFNRALLVAVLGLGTAAFFLVGENAREEPAEKATVYFFYAPGCPDCVEQAPIYRSVKQDYPELDFREYDASSLNGSAVFRRVAGRAGLDESELQVPVIVVGDWAFPGVHAREEISRAIDQWREYRDRGEAAPSPPAMERGGPAEFDLPLLGRTDLTGLSLPALAVVLGLVDGFNPCAMWVLVYMISLLIGINDRKKIWTVAGSFVLASGVLYFLFMTAWINVFLLLGYVRILTIAIGMVAVAGGALNLREYFASRRGLVCRIGDEEAAARTMGRIERIISQPLSPAILLSIIGLAFVVNSVEFVCSAAIPAVFTQVLAISGLTSFQHYFYIGLYTIFFMLDQIVIFSLAAFAIGSSLGERYARVCKLVGGAILAGLGAIMLFAPHWLR